MIMDTMQAPDRDAVMAHELWPSPEFKAFCERFGIPWGGLRTTGLVVTIPLEGLVTVQHTYQASQVRADTPDTVDTTTTHNKVYRTSQPALPRRGD